MNQGEKKVFIWVGIAFAMVIALTVYLEVQYQQSQEPSSQQNHSALSDDQSIASTAATIVIPKGLSPDDLPDAESRGATMLTLYCAQCHELPTPAMHTQSEWKDVLGRMKQHMQSSRGGMLRRVLIPPENDWNILAVYLDKHAQVPLDKTLTSDLDTPAGMAFQSTCSQCHAAPNPGTHTASEWPRVVLRMKTHIMRTGKKMPDQDTLMQIIDYLQQHGKTT